MDDSQRDELIVRIDERVLAIQSTLEVGDRRLNDHGARLRLLERWRSGIVAAISAVLALVMLAMKLR